MRKPKLSGLLALLFSTLLSCSHAQISDTERAPANDSNTSRTDSSHPLRICAALRGNGPRVFATIEGLATVTERFGVLNGMAGGSSGSIATFLYESLLLNPVINICLKDKNTLEHGFCSEQEVANRVALLLRSVSHYISNEGSTGSLRIASLDRNFTKGYQTPDAQMTFLQRYHALSAFLREHNDLINRAAALKWASTATHSIHRANWELLESLKLLSCQSDGSKLFYRQALPDLPSLTEMLAKIANFYAGYYRDAMVDWSAFFDQCADQTFGKSWEELEKKWSESNTNGEFIRSRCGDMFDEMQKKYIAALKLKRNNPKSQFYGQPDRATDQIGVRLPALIAVSAFHSESGAQGKDAIVSVYRRDLQRYKNGESPVNLFHPSSANFRSGYFGSTQDLAKVDANLKKNYQDYKSKIFLALGGGAWLPIVHRSIAEPGLSVPLIYDDNTITFGGWMEAHPVPVLKSLGCEKVVYINREGTEGDLPRIASLLGLSNEQIQNIYSLSDPKAGSPSSHQIALRDADAVYCTDWQKQPMDSPYLQSTNAHESEMLTDDLELKNLWNSHGALDSAKNSLRVKDKSTSTRVGCAPNVYGVNATCY